MFGTPEVEILLVSSKYFQSSGSHCLITEVMEHAAAASRVHWTYHIIARWRSGGEMLVVIGLGPPGSCSPSLADRWLVKQAWAQGLIG